MKKKLIILSLATIAFFASAGFKLNAISAEDTVKKDDLALIDDPVVSDKDETISLADVQPALTIDMCLKDVSDDEPQLEEPPLSQEEYDNLLKSIPKDHVIVGEVKVLPGVIKDPSREIPESSIYE